MSTQLPSPSPSPSQSIWSKVDYRLVEPVVDKPEKGKDPDDESRKRKWRWTRRTLDVLGTIFWAYALLKVFVTDIDGAIAGLFGAEAENAVRYRFFGFVALLVIGAAVSRKLSGLILTLLYIAFFPLIVLFWKIPRAIHRTRSWVAFFAVFNGVASFVTELRYTIVSSGVFVLGGFAILASDDVALIEIAAGGIAIVLVIGLARAVRQAAAPSRFLRVQQNAIRRAVGSDIVKSMTSVNAELRHTDLVKFSAAQQTQFVQNLSHGVIVHRFLYFWGYQLEQYRKSPTSILFTGLSYVWIVIQSLAALSLINYAIYKVDPDEFGFANEPSIAVFVRYSFGALYGNEIDALKPAGDVANVVSLLAAVMGILILATLLVSLLLSFRQSRDETALRDTIDEIRNEGRKFDEQLRAEWEVSADEAMERLQELRSSFLGVITFFSSRIPPGFEEHE